MEADSGSTRPRRSTRTPAKTPAKAAMTAVAIPESPVQGKRKAREVEKSPAEKLEYLLTNPKSKLTNLDISVSESIWGSNASLNMYTGGLT